MSDEKTQLEFDGIRLSVPVGEGDIPDKEPEKEPEAGVHAAGSSPENDPVEDLDICLRPPLEDLETAAVKNSPVIEKSATPVGIAPRAEVPAAAVPLPDIPAVSAPGAVKKVPVRAILREPEVISSGGKRGSKKGCLIFLLIILLIAGISGFAWWKYRAWCWEKIDQLKNLAGLTEKGSASSAEENGETSSASPAVAESSEISSATTDAGNSASTPTASAVPPAAVPVTGNLLDAAKQGNKDLVLRLISEGADISETDADGNSILHHAAASGNVELMVELLRKYPAGINVRNNNGDTPLHLAASGNHAGVIRVLRSKRAMILTNNAGKKPVDLSTDENVRRIFRNW